MILLLFSDHRSIQKNIWLLHSPLKQRATTDNAICIISLSISILEKISKFLLITKYVFVVDISYFLLWIYACLATLNLHTSETAKSHLEWTNGIVQDQSASDDCGQIHFYGSGLLSGFHVLKKSSHVWKGNVWQKQNWSQEFTQAAVLPRSDAGSDDVEQHRVSSKNIRVRTLCGVSC